MKAYQLKIAIKKSKPPIWRRVIVPAGITFSQLSMILNEVMGWSGYHLFEYEFYHMRLRLMEEVEDFWIGYDLFSNLDASSTYIEKYLEANDWFTYTYDLGDCWEHRVTVEKIIPDYEYNYPKVVKYKGDCPMEDCGGIYGYYDCLDIVNDKSHPEYEERMEWMESQGFPNTYDMEYVNEQLEAEYFYKWGRGENRLQKEIYMAHFEGETGLNATKRQGMGIYLNDIFKDYSKKDLAEIAKDKGIKGISNCKKDVLIEKMTDYMLQPDVMKQYLLCLSDSEMDEFEQAAESYEPYDVEDMSVFLKLYEAAYIGMIEDGRIIIPADVAEVYKSVKKDVLMDKQKIRCRVLLCLRTGGLLYGITPMDILIEMLHKRYNILFTEKELIEEINQIPPEYMEYVIVDKKIYHQALYPDDHGILAVQKGKEYYIPTEEEIEQLGATGYFPESKELDAFANFLVDKMHCNWVEAETIGNLIQMQISGGCRMQDVADILEDFGVIAENKKQLNMMIKLLNTLWNNTRMLANRGYKTSELSLRNQGNILQKSKAGTIIDFNEAKKSKIYPNDPCPCGSGKKYKKCCGKNK